MALIRARAVTVSFPLIDSSQRPARKTGLTFSAGEVKISKDGASFANTTNLPAEIGSTGRYKLDLTAAELDGKLVHLYVSKTGIDDYDERYETSNHRSGAVVTDAGNTSSTFKTDLTEAVTDYWKDSLLMFTSGSLIDQVKKVSAFNPTTDFVTLASAFTAAPANGDRFVLISF